MILSRQLLQTLVHRLDMLVLIVMRGMLRKSVVHRQQGLEIDLRPQRARLYTLYHPLVIPVDQAVRNIAPDVVDPDKDKDLRRMPLTTSSSLSSTPYVMFPEISRLRASGSCSSLFQSTPVVMLLPKKTTS